MSDYKTVGFIGLGVMGEPICRNLVKKSGKRVIAFDLSPEPLARLRVGVRPGKRSIMAGSVARRTFSYFTNDRDGARCKANASTLSLARG